jgi:methionyl-tRNA formyltransferase
MAGPPPPSVSDPARPPLKIVFMGTPSLAAHILERLLQARGADFNVTGVVTRPDRPRRRGLRMEASEVGVVAERYGIKALKPAKIRTPEFLSELRAFEPDLLVVAAYGRILPNDVLEAARVIPINVHASLLPRHRGAAPIEGAILAGDSITGVTIMRITERMDAGPILLQRWIEITANETQASLKEKLAELGASALLEALGLIHRGDWRETPQEESEATYTKIVKKDDARIDWNADAAVIERMTRAYDPWPVARTTLNGEDLMLYRARVLPLENIDSAPGTIIRMKPAVTVKCGHGALEVLEVQAAARRRMAAADFFRGRRVEAGTRLGT